MWTKKEQAEVAATAPGFEMVDGNTVGRMHAEIERAWNENRDLRRIAGEERTVATAAQADLAALRRVIAGVTGCRSDVSVVALIGALDAWHEGRDASSPGPSVAMTVTKLWLEAEEQLLRARATSDHSARAAEVVRRFEEATLTTEPMKPTATREERIAAMAEALQARESSGRIPPIQKDLGGPFGGPADPEDPMDWSGAINTAIRDGVVGVGEDRPEPTHWTVAFKEKYGATLEFSDSRNPRRPYAKATITRGGANEAAIEIKRHVSPITEVKVTTAGST